MKQSIFNLSANELGQYMKDIGEPLFRSKQIFSALHQATAIENMTSIPKALRERLQQDFDCDLPEIEKEVVSKDGTRKYLLRLKNGQKQGCNSETPVYFEMIKPSAALVNKGETPSRSKLGLRMPPDLSTPVCLQDDLIECVLLTQDYGKTVCVSTQVGCKMNCAFCSSGECGFIRNLSAGEILAQVILTSKTKRVTNVVLMGSGEPFDNYDNTIKFLQLATHPDGINISGRNISVSTAGLPDKIRAFADLQLQVNLCISLHAPNDAIRTQIMPIAKAHPIKDLIAAAQYFFDRTHRRIIFEYSLIDNINCEPHHAKELASLLKSQNFAYHVNLINLNPNYNVSTQSNENPTPNSQAPEKKSPVPEKLILQPPPREKALVFMDTLIKSGVSCTMRKSRGSDIDGACGQLRAKICQSQTETK